MFGSFLSKTIFNVAQLYGGSEHLQLQKLVKEHGTAYLFGGGLAQILIKSICSKKVTRCRKKKEAIVCAMVNKICKQIMG